MASDQDIRTRSPHAGMPREATWARNPRRCSPEDSVLLRPDLKSRLTTSNPSNLTPTNIDGQHGVVVHQGQRHERQRSESISSAEGWFKETNENVNTRNGGLLSDPPFYLDSNPNESRSDLGATRQPGWGSTRFASKDSENSDLRDVIDDLTVENKTLKRKLRKYEKSQISQMYDDKMLEVTVHGLSASRQRDLEELLKDFVTKVNIKDRRAPRSSTNASSNYMGEASGHSRVSKNPSFLHADSAYASMAKSGSNTNSARASNSTTSYGRAEANLSSKSKNRNVRSYLHNIPESLMPKVMPRALSERERKKLVVQRLEHIFTGRLAAPGPHSQPMQQQEVSNSAAREHLFGFEGTREAHIMSDPQGNDLEHSPKRRKNSHSEESDDSPHTTDRQGQAIEQRPTRPLDLDIHRAQVPDDNLQYIRHLGLPSPTRHEETPDEGWVYLNLLINMAQLHTINVTPEFIKRAVADMSEKFEISPDGRKVRWRGGEEGTHFSSDSGSNADHATGVSPPESNGSRQASVHGLSSAPLSRHPSTSDAMSSRALPSRSASGQDLRTDSAERSSSSRVQNSRSSKPFDYKPMILRNHTSYGESDDYGCPEYESRSSSRYGFDDTTARSSSNMMAASGERQQGSSNRNDGPLIFYRNAGYYTDLHGERKALSKAKAPVECSQHVLGVKPSYSAEADSDVHQPVSKEAVRPIRPEEVDVASFPSLKLVPLSSATALHENFQEFPVSGIGGVIPDDNFLLDVKTQHLTVINPTGKRNRRRSAKAYKILSAEKLDLPPSRLPPPSYVFLQITSSSSSGLDDTDSDEFTDSSVDEEMHVPPTMLNQLSSNSYEDRSDHDNEGVMEVDDDGTESEESDEDDGEEEDDDESIDMLHTARAANPEAIAAQEREYEMGDLERILPSELPAGSSAATVDGGSGYASPTGSPMSTENCPPSLKRGRSTTDSLAASSQSRKALRT